MSLEDNQRVRVKVKMDKSLATFRKLLWLNHGCNNLYGDDGEMQCANCRIDFLRDSVETISFKLAKDPIRSKPDINNMSREEFLEEYKDLSIHFVSYYKYKFTYRGVKDGRTITVVLSDPSMDIYRSHFYATTTIKSSTLISWEINPGY